ncbi:hypothetical protein SLA2020_405850 [Shorea laevis]
MISTLFVGPRWWGLGTGLNWTDTFGKERKPIEHSICNPASAVVKFYCKLALQDAVCSVLLAPYCSNHL